MLPSPCDATLTTITDELIAQGWSINHDFLSPDECRTLAQESHQLWTEGSFRRAGVGYGETLRVREDIRTDHVHWLDEATLSPGQRRYFVRLEELRQTINRRLYLGLFEFEGHFAVYPPGSFYKRHLDQFKGVELRTVTCVYYLNEGWQAEDGGQLRLYLDENGVERHFDILPTMGTLVTFLSGEYEHEVLPSRRERMSLTGWFRRRG